jgi:hypothetical protein
MAGQIKVGCGDVRTSYTTLFACFGLEPLRLSIGIFELLDAIAFHHNAKPRKSLSWKSPAELFLPEGSFDFQAYRFTIINPVAFGT